ncbi:YhgE/Pip family protein [Corynebacterium striatum]|uniref:YhgE/Pip family protein n=1 Tax=Corynebacterium striatum TaxID=43770 RepID=UPI003F7D73A2
MLIVFLLVAPVILAATMMWAMWDPSKYMRQIDLAVVNEDAGVEKQGKYVNYGDQVVEGLLETDYLNFAEMNAQEANDGLLKGKYLMVVTIPKDFSEQAVTIISDKPVKPQSTSPATTITERMAR